MEMKLKSFLLLLLQPSLRILDIRQRVAIMTVAKVHFLQQGPPLVRDQVVNRQLVRAAVSQVPIIRLHVTRRESLRVFAGLEYPPLFLWLLPILHGNGNPRAKVQVQLQEIATVELGRLPVAEVRVVAEEIFAGRGFQRIL